MTASTDTLSIETTNITYTTADGATFVLRYGADEEIPTEITVDRDGPGGKEPETARWEPKG